MNDKAGGAYLAADIGPQPPPLVAMQPVTDLPSPAKLLLGITAKLPAGTVGAGWTWVAYRSVGFARRAKHLDDPERWIGVELVTVRLAGAWREQDGVRVRDRVVVCWTRPTVHLTKGAISKTTGRRLAVSTWKNEAWSWVSGLPGSIPLDTSTDNVKAMIRKDQDMPPRTRKATVVAPGSAGVGELNAAADGTFTPDPLTEDGRQQISAVLTALDRTPELVGMLRSAFETLSLHAAAEQLPYDVPIAGDLPSLEVARRELDGIVERTGHPALRVVLDRVDLAERAGAAASAGYDPACPDCAHAEDATGHWCTECPQMPGVGTEVPHGYTLCAAHVGETIASFEQTLTDTEARANAAETAVEATDDLASANAEIERLLAQVEELRGDRTGDLPALDPAALLARIAETGAFVPVPKRWADIVDSDVFVGRKQDLWVVDTPMGERDEFTKGKGTVKVRRCGKVYARDFDPDDTGDVLVSAAVEAAHQVLMDRLGASALLGPTTPIEAAS